MPKGRSTQGGHAGRVNGPLVCAQLHQPQSSLRRCRAYCQATPNSASAAQSNRHLLLKRAQDTLHRVAAASFAAGLVSLSGKISVCQVCLSAPYPSVCSQQGWQVSLYLCTSHADTPGELHNNRAEYALTGQACAFEFPNLPGGPSLPPSTHDERAKAFEQSEFLRNLKDRTTANKAK